MIITIILFIISLLLEGIIPNLLIDFVPFFLLAVVCASSEKLKKNKYYTLIFIFGVISSLFYTTTLFLNGFIFLFLGYLLKHFLGKKDNFFKMFFTYILICIIYILIMILFTFSYNSNSLYYLGKAILNSALINILYFLIIYMIYFVKNYIFSNRKNKKSY